MSEKTNSTDVAIVCPDFTPENKNKQPWRYFLEVGEYLEEQGYQVIILTDQPSEFDSEPFNVINIPELFGTTSVSNDLVDSIYSLEPDYTILNVTPSLFLRGRIGNELPGVIIGVVTSTMYKPKELIRLGVWTNFRYRKYMYRFLMESMLPKRIVRNSASSFDYLITLSESNKKRLEPYFKDEIYVVAPGIDNNDLKIPSKKETPLLSNTKPSILYFTSPLTLRGTDVLTKAFSRVREEQDSELVLLSRPDSDKMNDEEAHLRKISEKRNVNDDFHLLSKHLDSDLIRSISTKRISSFYRLKLYYLKCQ